ncbi:hypothetical protein ACFX1Q_007243 [Malus domestica]
MASLPQPKPCHPNLHGPKPKPCHPRPTAPKPRPKPCHSKPNALPSQAQTSHSRAPHAEQPTLVAQPAPMTSQEAQVGPRLSQTSGPTIEPKAFSPYFSTHLIVPNSNLVPGVYHPSIAQEGIFFPSSSNPNGEQHLSRKVIELTSALAQQTTLVISSCNASRSNVP